MRIDENGNLIPNRPAQPYSANSRPAPPYQSVTVEGPPAEGEMRRGCRWPIHPIFIGLVVLFFGFVTLLHFVGVNKALVFAVVLTAWVISLALHEWGHAVTAYFGGDYSVVEKGYLTLDFTKYVDPVMSIGLPFLMLLVGGIPMPGGAVWIQTSSLRSKTWETAVSLAGPLANFVCCAILGVLTFTYATFVNKGSSDVVGSLALAAYFQALAVWINLIPLPPLDGWGALSVWLSDECWLKKQLQNPTHRMIATLLTFVVIWLVVQFVPPFGWVVRKTATLFGPTEYQIAVGYTRFKIPTHGFNGFG
uniref:Peptidase M50 domain-containing protein n=1 Tax=Chromera velia CCMP2878 TaxID=1169474 RepID=A0A0G4HIU7_9ALVE|mmetsp:Transcript_3089/g.6305  ORF Transcript_3089/g.6305 Transcript_3089/m.6305 type:complete len:306 (-) Transcript_3089:69-986(-)|eukprot:Cvel_27974.t1-p1 / transcript=Cvel_27974.t1 / gene=Cvel_27974 / organism=Chromera_velia_CCMP2878 / gene_product=Putative zinc metalloprotease Rip2, putative / transcript_product=Putative zinc metalloprotease Rip2, putative / location=Cvel_scaffold3576:3327-6856(-) / protein_length=305 / sequence_SO=supercontig / SO=protein_coding / is_pseudo=false